MSSVSFREKNMLIIVGVIALYAFAALSYKKQSENWKIAKRAYQNAEKKYQEENALIAASKDWSEKYEQMRSLMPVFPYEKDVDTHWLNVMDSLAIKNSLTITRRQTNKETEVGDVYELPIECKDWEGSLESLVKFLYDLQKEGAMLDVRQVFIRPSARPGFLKGTFTLYCAYMRGAEQKEAGTAAPATEDEKDNAEAPVPQVAGSTNRTDAIVPAAVLPETTGPDKTNAPTETTEQTK
jgi:hypothetical protein